MIGTVAILAWAAAVIALGQGASGLAARVFRGFPDRGVPFAKPIALVIVAWVSGFCSSLGVPHGRSLIVGLAVLAVLAWTMRRTDGAPLRERAMQEATFVAALVVVAGLRALDPAIFGAEKYMDFAFFNTLVRAEDFPPEDPWLAGARVHYYTLGYLLFANVARLVPFVAPEVAYNVAIGVIGAMLFTSATSIGRALTGRFDAGLLGGIVLVGIGNLDGFLQLVVEGKGFARFDFWRSSRVVPDTINEFPFFSLLHGDLHAHVTASIVLVGWIGIVVAAARDRDAGAEWRFGWPGPSISALLVVFLAVLALANPWDLPVALTFAGLVTVARFWTIDRPLRSLGAVAIRLAALVGLGLAATLAFPRDFPPFQGVGRVHAETALWHFIVVFGVLLLPVAADLGRRAASWLPDEPPIRNLALSFGAFTAVVLFVATRNWVVILSATLVTIAVSTLLGGPSPPSKNEAAVRPPGSEAPPHPGLRDVGEDAPLALAATAAILLLACEIVYLRDSYGHGLHRMNTVFKLYFQAWIFLAVAFPWFVFRLIDGFPERSFGRRAVLAVLGAGLAASACYPIGAVTARWQGRLSLDGFGYLERDHPDDAAAIRWLRGFAADRPVVLEATGDPYSYFARVSANTGFPTVLGWANHEGVWRGSDGPLARRRQDVDTMYTTPDDASFERLLRRYRVRLVFVGELERRTFPAEALARLEKRSDLLRLKFRSGGTSVFEVALP